MLLNPTNILAAVRYRYDIYTNPTTQPQKSIQTTPMARTTNENNRNTNHKNTNIQNNPSKTPTSSVSKNNNFSTKKNLLTDCYSNCKLNSNGSYNSNSNNVSSIGDVNYGNDRNNHDKENFKENTNENIDGNSPPNFHTFLRKNLSAAEHFKKRCSF